MTKAIQMKQQGNDVVILLDSAGMEHLKTFIFEMGIKSSVAAMYTAAKNAEQFYRSR